MCRGSHSGPAPSRYGTRVSRGLPGAGRTRALVVALGLATAVTAAESTAGATSTPRARVAQACAGADTIPLTPVDAEAALVCLINAARGATGAMTIDGRLTNAEQQHAAAMAAGGPFSTTDPISPDQRAKNAGLQDYATGTAAEFIYVATTQPLATPRAAVNQWLASADGARLTDPEFTLVGAGAVTTPAANPPKAVYALMAFNKQAAGTPDVNGDIGPGAATGGGRDPFRPLLGRAVLLSVVSGIVRVTPPDGGTFRLSGRGRLVPTGSDIDTTAGRVRLTAALPGRRTQRADFYDGSFRVSQNRRGLTTLTLTGSLAVCGGARARAASAHRGSVQRGSMARRLWGNGKGSYSTRGSYAAATVRGTIWLTADYCGGTLIKVRRGAVRVTGIRRKLSVLVKPGHPYFVPKKR